MNLLGVVTHMSSKKESLTWAGWKELRTTKKENCRKKER